MGQSNPSNVPPVDSTKNQTFREAIGNKEDTKSLTADTSSVMAMTRLGAKEAWEVEHHFHTRRRWFGKVASQTATNWGESSLAPFRAISGDNVWGADANDEAQVVGTADSPVFVGSTHMDPHEIMVIGTSVDTVFMLRLIWGTGTMADAITDV